MTKNIFEKAGNFTSEDTLRMANLNRVTDAISMSYVERNGGPDWAPSAYLNFDPTQVTWGIFDMPTTKLAREIAPGEDADKHINTIRNLKPAINPVAYPDKYNQRYYDFSNSANGWTTGGWAPDGQFYLGYSETRLPKLTDNVIQYGNFNPWGSGSTDWWFNPNRWDAFVSVMNYNSVYENTVKQPIVTPVWYLEDVLAELGVYELEPIHRMHQPSRKWFKQMHDIHQILGTKQIIANSITLDMSPSGYDYYSWTDAIRISKLPRQFYNITWYNPSSGISNFTATMREDCGYPVTADRWIWYGADYTDIPAVTGISRGFYKLDTVHYDSIPDVSTQFDVFPLVEHYGGWHWSWLNCFSIIDYKARWKYYPW